MPRTLTLSLEGGCLDEHAALDLLAAHLTPAAQIAVDVQLDACAECRGLVSLLARSSLAAPLPLHGVGASWVQAVFEAAGVGPLLQVVEQRDPDPAFPTVRFPN